jgi:predicted SprT family Zn-dependent metalloprotease
MRHISSDNIKRYNHSVLLQNRKLIYKGDSMSESKLRVFTYNCKCGHMVKAFFDFGVPQEFYKCRKCGKQIRRVEG